MRLIGLPLNLIPLAVSMVLFFQFLLPKKPIGTFTTTGDIPKYKNL